MAEIRGLKLNFSDNGEAKAITVDAPHVEYSCHIKDCEFFEVIQEQIGLPDKFSVTVYHLLCTAAEDPVSIFDIEKTGKCPRGYWTMPGRKP